LYILLPFGLFYGHLGTFCGRFMVTWYIFPVLVRCTKKNLATLSKRGFDTMKEAKISIRLNGWLGRPNKRSKKIEIESQKINSVVKMNCLGLGL
jgi:hypothetical protein